MLFFFFIVPLFSARPFTVPQVLRKGNKPEDEEESEEEEEGEPLQVLKSFQKFLLCF